MNGDQLHGRWREVKGIVLENWGRVVHDPWTRIAGRRERLLGRLEASLASSRQLAEASFARTHAAARSSRSGAAPSR
jgi:uncharacterized protein YjbJ (UPF0337 family)